MKEVFKLRFNQHFSFFIYPYNVKVTFVHSQMSARVLVSFRFFLHHLILIKLCTSSIRVQCKVEKMGKFITTIATHMNEYIPCE